ncbi:MAG: hypothetical protein Q9174_003422, partial [Haloplaca sp. 1 TL-2023]
MAQTFWSWVSNYAAVAADTFSSELGILSKSRPRLLTSWNFREVPPGTNGGITIWGTLAGFLGASTIALTSVILLPFCTVGLTNRTGKLFGDNQSGLEGGSGWGLQEKAAWFVAITLWGGFGSLLDSALGGWFQESVVDAKTGKVIEGTGGARVSAMYRQDRAEDADSRSRIESSPPNMSPTLKQSGSKDIRDAIDETTADVNNIPGCVFVVVNKEGKTLFEHASGKRGADTQAPMTLDSIFWIASCTKMICGIAAMQLVEQDKLDLDDADKVEELCPELAKVRILKSVDENGKAELVEKKNRITMRMLLSHTAGFGYSFFNHDIRRWGQPSGCDEFSGHVKDVLGQPLLFEPGTDWQYGVGIDWAGTVVERISGMSLNDYFQKNIFQPLGIKNISFFPSAEMKETLAHMNQKHVNGQIRERDHLLGRPLIVEGDDVARTFNSAGAGCFARPAEYCQLLATLLNSGTSPITGNRILSRDSITQ